MKRAKIEPAQKTADLKPIPILDQQGVTLGPLARSLFERLPVPIMKGNGKGQMSLTGALKAGCTNKTTLVRVAMTDASQKKQFEDPEEDDVDDKSRESKANVIDVSADDLLNKGEFYRRQLQNHSVSMFHRQIINRNKSDASSQAQGELALKGKKKN